MTTKTYHCMAHVQTKDDPSEYEEQYLEIVAYLDNEDGHGPRVEIPALGLVLISFEPESLSLILTDAAESIHHSIVRSAANHSRSASIS
jgi:hypothetical protein